MCSSDLEMFQALNILETADDLRHIPAIITVPFPFRFSVLYSLYWVFWGGVQKKEVKKGKIGVNDVKVSTAACI